MKCVWQAILDGSLSSIDDYIEQVALSRVHEDWGAMANYIKMAFEKFGIDKVAEVLLETLPPCTSVAISTCLRAAYMAGRRDAGLEPCPPPESWEATRDILEASRQTMKEMHTEGRVPAHELERALARVRELEQQVARLEGD